MDPVPDGSALLLEGPPLVGKREHALRMLAHGLDAGDAGIVLTTERTAPEVVDALAAFTAGRDSSSEASLSADDLMVIDCTGDRATSDAAVPAQTQYVNSPTDLTGAGIALSDALQAFTDSHDSIRLLTDSLTSLLVYRDLKPVFEFFHNLNKWTTQVAGLSLVVSETDLPGDESLSEFAPLFDGHVQFRQESGATELRVSRLQGGATGWVTPPPVASARPDDSAPDGVTDGTREVPDVREVISDVPASLADILADARQNSQAVTAVNVTDERRLDVVESYLDRFDVPVRERALDAPTPADFAVLHQGSEYVAGASLAELAAAITVERSGADSFSERSYPELLTYVDQSVFTADGAWREQLVQTSRHVEMLAWRHGRGELHAGFQQLSRMRDAYGTREIYEKIAERDVDVHVYGNPDLDRPLDGSFTVHGSEAAEIRDTWFTVFVDGANPSRAGTLIAEERDQGRYHGFWSFDPAVGAVARRYVVDSYGADSPE